MAEGERRGQLRRPLRRLDPRRRPRPRPRPGAIRHDLAGRGARTGDPVCRGRGRSQSSTRAQRRHEHADPQSISRDLGQTLRRVATEGPDVFYEGEIARRIAGHIQEHGGLIAETDLARYRPAIVDGGQETTYRGYRIVGVPGACGSITVQQGLNILEGFDLPSLGAGTVERLHLEAEAFRRAFSDRYRFASDPKQDSVPWRGLLSKQYAAARRAEIDPTLSAAEVCPGDPHRFDDAAQPVSLATAATAPL